MRRITALPGRMRRRRPPWRLFHKHFTTAALFVPAKLHVQNGCPIHSYCNPNDNGLPCCNGLTGVSANKNVELAFTLMLTKVQRICGVFEASFTVGRGVPEGRGQPVFVE